MQLKSIGFIFLVACCAFSGCFPSTPEPEPESDPDTEDGSDSVVASPLVADCALCHSVKEAQRGPILHGMDEWYLADQIEKFRSGTRGKNPANRSEYLMGVAVKKVLDDEQGRVLAKWFAAQQPVPALRTIRGDVEKGALLYAARCASCHGEKGEGKRDSLSPSLTHLEGWYFIDQMRKFRNGMRGKDPSDVGGQAMAAAVADFTPQQTKDVVAYAVEAFGLPEAPSTRRPLRPRPLDRNGSRE